MTSKTTLAAALLAALIAGPAFAQDTSAEPDCPEDMDIEPGCDISGAEASEPGPVPGAATAPVPPEVADDEGGKSLASPEGDPAESTEADDANAEPQVHEVSANGVRFDPMFIYIEPGDQVIFTSMPSHNVETLDGLVPEGQEKVETELGENVTITFDEVGIVSYKCTPHWGNRMGGMIVVGSPENPGQIIEEYLERAEETPELLPALGLLKKLRADMQEKGLLESS